MLAPLVLLVYNRPYHTRLTVEALQRNELAADSELFIFSDAALNDEGQAAVQEVREFVRTISGFKKVTIVERDKNLGLASSIISGVTEIVNRAGKVIVLEDDLVTSPFFLRYMNDALEFYHNEERVMHVSAGTYPVGDCCRDDTYFLRIPLCWGWGTWKRSWQHFKKEFTLMRKFNSRMISRFDFDGTYPYWRQLEMNRDGILNTWFVFWYAMVFLKEGLALFPQRSLVKNIGHDGSGVHCGSSDVYDVELSSSSVRISGIPLQESEEAFRLHKQYFSRICRGQRISPLHNMLHIIRKVVRA